MTNINIGDELLSTKHTDSKMIVLAQIPNTRIYIFKQVYGKRLTECIMFDTSEDSFWWEWEVNHN